MANETDTGLTGQNNTAEVLTALAARPFDPAALLSAPSAMKPLPGAEAVPYPTGPAAEVVHTFDPAANLGDAARRGPAMIGDGKPLVARIGGVDVVTIPLEHYAALLSPFALAKGTPAGAAALDAEGMFGLLMAKADKRWQTISLDDIRRATGLDDAAFGGRVAAWKEAQPKPGTLDSMDADGTMHGKMADGTPLRIGPALTAAEVAALDMTPPLEPAPVEVAPTPEEATVDLAPKLVEVASTPAEQADTYFNGTRDGTKRGGAMGRKGEPDNREVDIHDQHVGRRPMHPRGSSKLT